ncbi:hypothetical protein GDO81_016856 [Engystomops pustulosus]|uniref:Uncharacterized protein n=1 Tax=Engystomops pustulosus TaxID=76066 RepID=A0AAV7AD86_ENGPU|nr:hypothetical protein GDO81_016856 [Engystomops pustulosus]
MKVVASFSSGKDSRSFSLEVPPIIWFSNPFSQQVIVLAIDVVATFAFRFSIADSQVFFKTLSDLRSMGSLSWVASSKGRSVFLTILVIWISTFGIEFQYFDFSSSNTSLFLKSLVTDSRFSGSFHSSRIRSSSTLLTGNTLFFFALKQPKSSSCTDLISTGSSMFSVSRTAFSKVSKLSIEKRNLVSFFCSWLSNCSSSPPW